MLRNICHVLLIMLFVVPQAEAFASDSAPPGTLKPIIQEALKNNEDLKAAEARWQMFERKIVPAGTLDDPVLSLGLVNYPVDSFRDDEIPMTGQEIKLSQKFPFPGKLTAKSEMADQQALWYKSAYEDAKLQLVQKVKDGYYRLYFQDRAIAVTEENLGILKTFVSLTKTRYEVGSGLQQDLLKAQVEQSKLLDRLLTLRQQRTSVLADLNRLLSRPGDTPLEMDASPDLTPVLLDSGQLKKAARSNRPMFASYRSLIARYESQRKLARLDSYPNFNLWAGYRFRDDDLPDGGTDFLSAGVGITLPIWRQKRSEEVAEADAGINMARRQLEEFANQVDFTIEDSWAQLEKNRDLAQLFATGIIPQAQQSFDASLAAYRVGKVEFLSLLDSLMTLYRYQLDYERALSDYQRDLARLEMAAGIDPTVSASNQDQPTDRMKP